MKTKEERKIYEKQWRENNSQHVKDYAKQYGLTYYPKNKERLKAIRRKWEEDNKDTRWLISKEYRDRNREKIRLSSSAFRKTYPEIVLNRVKTFNKTTKGRFNSTKNGAYRRGLDFEINLPLFEEIISKDCTYCGDGKGYIGIDRVDNSKGYTLENICPCCTLCNMMKKTLSKDMFLEHIKRIANFNN